MCFLIFLALVLAGCGGLEVIPPSSPKSKVSGNLPTSARDTYQTYESLHFRLQGKNFLRLKEIAKTAEEIYSKVMFDTNLFTFKPRQNYLLVVYADPNDYFKETGNPPWSGGATITELAARVLPSEREEKARTSIFMVESALTVPILAHEITHLIFNEFVALSSLEEANFFRWLNEGLATYEEFSWREKSERETFLQAIQTSLKQFAMDFETMTDFAPFKIDQHELGSYFYKGERYVFTNIDLWYWQVRSVVGFLIEKQGRYAFFQFLNILKQKKNLTLAMADAYGAKWKNLKELENEWRQSL